MPGGSAGTAGQVLVSNGTGNTPLWQNMTATTGSKFLVTFAINSNSAGRMGFSTTSGASTQQDSVDLVSPRYNTGADVTINTSGTTNNFFLVNTTGLYHLEGVLSLNINQTTTGLSPQGNMELVYTELGPPNIFFSFSQAEILPQVDFISPFGYFKSIKFNIDIYFIAGTTFSFKAHFDNLTNYPLSTIGTSSPGYVAGYRISD